ncbi:MAG TPA: hypothetical protein VFE20_06595 [Thermoleophilia bacterium]|nr:hypothetical protein [Thermoleophilia bacterium]
MRRRGKPGPDREESVREWRWNIDILWMRTAMRVRYSGYDADGRYRYFYPWEPLSDGEKATLTKAREELTVAELTVIAREMRYPANPYIVEGLGVTMPDEKPTPDETVSDLAYERRRRRDC